MDFRALLPWKHRRSAASKKIEAASDTALSGAAALSEAAGGVVEALKRGSDSNVDDNK